MAWFDDDRIDSYDDIKVLGVTDPKSSHAFFAWLLLRVGTFKWFKWPNSLFSRLEKDPKVLLELLIGPIGAFLEKLG